jgi:hypothetical protein
MICGWRATRAVFAAVFALGRSYDGKFAHGRTARSLAIEITVDL